MCVHLTLVSAHNVVEYVLPLYSPTTVVLAMYVCTYVQCDITLISGHQCQNSCFEFCGGDV